jgi:hypothetical protein
MVLEYSEDKGVDGSIQHKCLVEWNDISISQSWVTIFALCLSNPTNAISIAGDQKLFDKSPFCHLILYYKVKPSVDMAKIHNFSSSRTAVKYKLEFRGINKNKNN